jgi:hypothetical protein
MTVKISRKKNMTNQVVFVDGQAGCGKTLFSPIIAALNRVELLTYAYEIEHYCSLKYLDKLSTDATHALIRLMTDLQQYNTMMGRELNFRPSDLSSVFNDHNPARYFQRMFQAGDEAIPDIISREQPILNLTTHNLLAYSEPIWQSLGERCVFIEIIRHPIYMVRQQQLNMERLSNNVRNFKINFEYKEKEIPFYAYGWEELYLNSNSTQKAIHSISQITTRTEKNKHLMRDKYEAQIITIPFEPFVLKPEPWIEKIANLLDTDITDSTKKAMILQNVPRQKIAEGVDLDIYIRCGWVPPIDGANEREELLVRREDFSNEAGEEVMLILDQLSDEYEKTYWNPDYLN